jgi:hypothetical protein
MNRWPRLKDSYNIHHIREAKAMRHSQSGRCGIGDAAIRLSGALVIMEKSHAEQQ